MDFTLLDSFLIFRILGTRTAGRILAVLCVSDSSSAFKEDSSLTAVMCVG